jgi:DNA-binding protein H-NS
MSAQTLDQIQKQIADLQSQADQMVREQKSGAISDIREKMAMYDITFEEIGGKGAGRKSQSKVAGIKPKVNPKFKNQDTGETWSGRGLKPRWLVAAIGAGKKVEDFKI